MARYIDADNAISRLQGRCINCRDYDSCTGCYIDKVIDELRKAPAADVVPKSEVSKARQDGYESGKREVVRELYIALYNEIIDARNSNFEAIKERETKHNVNRYEDMFCRYCDGKIHALDGILYFITELTEKYTDGAKTKKIGKFVAPDVVQLTIDDMEES